jgi:hypothetical protein
MPLRKPMTIERLKILKELRTQAEHLGFYSFADRLTYIIREGYYRLGMVNTMKAFKNE